MNISITMLDGTSHTLRVNPHDTVGSLKVSIQAKFRVPPEKQKLVFVNGQRTTLDSDSQPVSYYGLQSGSQLSLLVIQPPTIQVFLTNQQGKTSTYDVKLDETVGNFKKKVQCREGVQVSQQRLIHQSQDMVDDHKLLSEYNVGPLSTISLMGRLRGG